MNNPQPEIDIEKLVKTIKDNLAALREGFNPSILTQEERNEILKKLEY